FVLVGRGSCGASAVPNQGPRADRRIALWRRHSDCASTTAQALACSGALLDLLLVRRDHLLCDVRRTLLVAEQRRGEGAAPAGHRSEVGRVSEDLRERHVRFDALVSRAGAVHTQYATAAAVEVREHVAHLLLGYGDLDVHDRLE